MSENKSYLEEMLEVPMTSGYSEDVCGQDDNFYAFGLWTDFCGLTVEEMKKSAIANANGSSDCCSGGGGGGGDTGSTKTENVITITSTSYGTGYKITATADENVDTDVTVSMQYVILFDDGITETRNTSIKIKSGSNTGSVTIEPESGNVVKIKNNISVNPNESEKYKYTVKNDTDLKKNSVLYGSVLYVNMERYGIDALSYSVLRNFNEIYLTGGTTNITSERDAEVVDNYRGQPSIRVQHAYDFVLLIDIDLNVDNIVVTDLNSLGEGDEVDFDESIGFIEYDDELYTVYRLSNPTGWSVVVAPGEEAVGYTWKYKIQQK